ncbi:endo alpha-1,4 polygalactosaminidase [Streptomyces sp. H10-C2]|uniref:endo alpha-1,4 polygalactosaminidase n=1 Tax=unclassified Streptomyces TaxID=2593676 RepID=UPI0024BABBFB|nr:MULTISPECIES: endo alpha-1,4 polygalactosaminidase [unclassified Streptomyces]MDJ0344972.1 endo alpha-1,4 polygalactosaminidase [Streptomyces sp. PH10-H1]MDJ0373947.1 endo alpha-1,4 polygalactosaminidase [Streptomyces sp. H10-C2]
MRRFATRSLPVALLLLLLAACGTKPDPGPEPDDRTTPAPSSGHWQPRPGTAWQWQLSGKVDTSVDVPVYDIDGFENDAAAVSRLHADRRKVICYVNAGAWEDFRSDRATFPAAVLGLGNGWKGERWLDIRRIDVLRPLMAKRFDMCRAKGFDAVEPDLMDAYTNRSGFPLTAADQLAYNRMLAGLAHERGMSVGLKNDLEQIPQLVGDFDFAVNEECAQNQECDALTPFIKAGKAVFHTEYTLTTEKFCPLARQLGLSSMQKRPGLDAWRRPC